MGGSGQQSSLVTGDMRRDIAGGRVGEEAAEWAAARGDGGVKDRARRSSLEQAGAGEERRAAGDAETCEANVQALHAGVGAASFEREERASLAPPRHHGAGLQEGEGRPHMGSDGRNRLRDGECSAAARQRGGLASRCSVGVLMVLLHVSRAGAQPCAHNPIIHNVSAVLGIQGTVLDSTGMLGATPVPGPQQIFSLPNSVNALSPLETCTQGSLS